MATFQLFFLVQGTGGSPTGPDPENRAGAPVHLRTVTTPDAVLIQFNLLMMSKIARNI
jgi:hypothetical protein